MENQELIYEQPVNELIRVCLRLEQLFLQIDHYSQDKTDYGTRNILATIIDILNVLDRADIKTKLAKELQYRMSHLTQAKKTAALDQAKFNHTLAQLEKLIHWCISSMGKVGQSLRETELINNLRLHLSTSGGGCSFDIPAYHFWLQQPVEEKEAVIKQWLAEFENIRCATVLLLQLLRENAAPTQKLATLGFYHESLDPHIQLHLIRVLLPYHIPAYPEISVGRHRLSIRFVSPSIKERCGQYHYDLPFTLYCCA